MAGLTLYFTCRCLNACFTRPLYRAALAHTSVAFNLMAWMAERGPVTGMQNIIFVGGSPDGDGDSLSISVAAGMGNAAIVGFLVQQHYPFDLMAQSEIYERRCHMPRLRGVSGWLKGVNDAVKEYPVGINMGAPLVWAAKAGAVDVVWLLLEHGADIEGPEAEGVLVSARKGLIERALHGGHTEVLRVLVENKVPIDDRDPETGYTPLRTAVVGAMWKL
ncbi:hypothetical protein BDW62DRAFT_205651 [Aspergillus aurantiobrunneus]